MVRDNPESFADLDGHDEVVRAGPQDANGFGGTGDVSDLQPDTVLQRQQQQPPPPQAQQSRTVQLNVIYDQRLTPEQKNEFKDGLVKRASEEFSHSNIQFAATYSNGTIDRATGNIKGNLQEGSLNVVATDHVPRVLAPQGESGVSGRYGKYYVSVVGVADGSRGVLSHEIAHQLLQHPDKGTGTLNWRYYLGEISVGVRRLVQGLGVNQKAFREGAQRFSAPQQ